MPSTPTNELIVIGGRSYQLSKLTEFGFIAPIQLPDGETQSQGVMILGDTKLQVGFRVRQEIAGELSCSFANLSIASAEVLRKYLKDRARVSSGNEALEARSYDELARGVVDNDETSAGSVQNAGVPDQKGYVKSFALMIMLFAMVGLAVLAVFFLRSRSSLSVDNSALVGNWLAVNAKVEGEISQIMVTEGDRVRKGDVLLRLVNPEITQATLQLEAELKTAQSKVAALQKQRKTFTSKLEYASRKLDLDREVAVSELEAAKKARKSAQAAFERLKPFVISGAITQLEIDEVENTLLEEEAVVIAKENLVRQIEFSKQAADSNILIIGDRVDDELGRIEAELEIAEAEALEFSKVLKMSLQSEGSLDVVAPRDGIVFVSYRHEGQFVKVADELMGLSFPGETWAAGQVSVGQASRVLPGQPVTIRIPAMDLAMEGTVMSVGHRAMYAKGNYNAEFRGTTATDVPVKVRIDNLPEDIPSGLRLSMSISTGFGLEWLDDAMGYELKQIGSSRNPIVTEPKSNTDALALKKSMLIRSFK